MRFHYRNYQQQEDKAFLSQIITNLILVYLKQAVQLAIGFLRPSICHHMIVIAKKEEMDGQP